MPLVASGNQTNRANGAGEKYLTLNGNVIFGLKQTQYSTGWLWLSRYKERDWGELFSHRWVCSQNAYPHKKILPQSIYLFNLRRCSTEMITVKLIAIITVKLIAHRSSSYLKSSMFLHQKLIKTIIKITPTCLHLCRRPLVAYKPHAFLLTSSWLRHQDSQHWPHFTSLTLVIAWDASVNTSRLFCINISFSWSPFDIHAADLRLLVWS